MHAFRTAVEDRDVEAALALLSDEVVFRSPVVFKEYRGREAVAPILHAVLDVFEDFEYVRELGSDDQADHALVFRANVAGRRLEGCDFLHAAADGSIDEFTVMVRPLSGVLALAEAMAARLAEAPHAS